MSSSIQTILSGVADTHERKVDLRQGVAGTDHAQKRVLFDDKPLSPFGRLVVPILLQLVLRDRLRVNESRIWLGRQERLELWPDDEEFQVE